MSGPDALKAVRALLASEGAVLDGSPSHSVRLVQLIDPESGQPFDRALCTVMRGPRSYTGEDVVELSCHGSPALLALVVERMCAAGARLAEPGEFTRRAFLNGRLDLARAEAIALVIEAKSRGAVFAAARAMSGDLSGRLVRLRDELLDLIAALEVALDFPDDGVGMAPSDACAHAKRLASDAAALTRATRRGRRLHEGVTVAIVGRTNAGKSSLFNVLAGRNRAIVSPIPGTTRDVIEATVELGGIAVRLLDTAGLGTPHDSVEAEGMDRSRAAIDESDVVLHVVDGSMPATSETLNVAQRPTIIVRSKADLPRNHSAPEAGCALAVSSTTREGLDELIDAIRLEAARLTGLLDDEDRPLAATLRQAQALESLASALDAGARALPEAPTEVALVDLHDALAIVSSLLGVEVGDEVLDRVFSRFCVGK